MFTPTEALSLVMAVLDGHHAAADPGDPVGSAVGKVLDALPIIDGPELRQAVAAVAKRMAAAASR